MYDDAAMKRRLVKGDVGEALFRYWFDKNVGQLSNLRLVHWGYFPLGIVTDEAKRKQLKTQSDPDYALVRRSDESKPLVGISVNSQNKPYNVHSTMGGFCVKCPRAISCYDYNEENLWFNEFNIKSDYAKFTAAHGVEVVLASLIASSIANVAKWVSDNTLEKEVHDYVQGGAEVVDDKAKLDGFIAKLAGRRQGRVKEFVWLLHSEVLDGRVPSFITGGWSNYGRPRLVYCVDMKLSRDKDSFISYLKSLDA
jgi:hypothetical protein